MNILDIARELRLKIFSELLVLPEPIVFLADNGPPSPPLFRSKGDELCLALLRINKTVYSEASTLLYSDNRFQFPEVFTSTPSPTESAHISPFLHQIGSQASHIRHICIPFPPFDYPESERAGLHQAHIRNLELIRDTCTSIRTLELLISPDCANYTLSDSPIAAEALCLLDTHFKNIPSLKEVVINFEVYPEQDPSNDLTKRMHDYGWTVKVTKLPEKIWISLDDRVEFDNEEDCQAYDNEQLLIEERERQREEEEEWLEEYYRRRRDPYWKNDSDYD
ncbi:hypothetical protein BU26DRAFT_524944 [Trematosphaeria pertusa]|uniref:Uncharacterized protein n=1 Tax=Trematosphaeria pertusa TaxID=390896 RepID=A0A6A6HUU7_9PLEO|nr:uncharacterized protein BU26DRAFT_524944 [Trematosphaeria pertusa]KAF2241797.1 hypothetical protein BU26DRAFT_524944 [Trematosphaeria pertusa]